MRRYWWGVLASWLPLADYLGDRLQGGTPEPVVLLLLGVLFWGSPAPSSLDLRLSAFFLSLRVVLGPCLPDLARATLTALSTASFLSSWRFGRAWHTGLASLMVLALPCLASLQFLLDYPLREVATRGAVALLNLSNQGVHCEGFTMVRGATRVTVDTACSGLKMIWAGQVFVAAMALMRGWPMAQTLRWQIGGGLLMVAANAWRAASVFVLESTMPFCPHGHEVIGLFVFSLALLVQVRCSPPACVIKPRNRPSRGLKVFALMALLSLVPTPRLPSSQPTMPFPGWWTHYQGMPLQPLPLSPQESAFYANFPGRVGRFTDGQRVILLRFVQRPTRRLHPASECYSAQGFVIRPQEGGFVATRKQETWWVRESIQGPDGHWTSLSQWWWQARRGPWWCVTVAERLSPPPPGPSH